MGALTMLQTFRILFFLIISFPSLSDESSNSLKSFIAGDYASMQSILHSIDAFDSTWGEQIGNTLNTLNLDKKYQNLNQTYKSCVLSISMSPTKLTPEEFIFKTTIECEKHMINLKEHIKRISK